MPTKFHDELNKLRKEVIKMGELSTDMLQRSIEALKTHDLETAKWVNENKITLADMDAAIENKALKLLTLHQPMAIDLREIGCILKIITYLARIGRYGKDIAKLTVEFEKSKHVKKLVSIPHMSQIVIGMIDDALKAFETRDLSHIDDIAEREDDVDQLRYSIFRECLSYMMEDQKKITPCTYYILVARYLERCADHSCKMAEKIHYMVKGEHIDIDPSSPASFNKEKKYI
jgi:phosphate transport system protein